MVAVIVLVSIVFGAVFVTSAARLADRGTALYRRDHGRRHPPTQPGVTAPVDADAWDALVDASDPGSYLQLSGWARVKAVNGWSAHRLLVADRVGAQVLVRRPRPLPWGFAYAPRGPLGGDWTAEDAGRTHGRRAR